MKYKLSDLCSYRKGKVDVSCLNCQTYISTENMLPNKAGTTLAVSLPTVQLTQSYKKGDVLVSNIRPYFKKIWLANCDGGCSNDVLVFESKNTVDNDFLYYVLADDAFFLYAMATSKGTKMPRGDRTSIMEYKVPLFDIGAQKKIASILKTFDDKIALNNAINNNLLDQAIAIFDNDFPSISDGNKQVGEYIIPKRGKNLLSKDAIIGNVPVIAGGLSPATYHNTANTEAPVVTISASGANAGFVNLWQFPVWSSDSSFIDSSMTSNVFFWYILLKKRQKEIFDLQTGSAQPHIYPQHISNLSICDLNIEEISNFTNEVTPLFKLIANNQCEILKLSSLRDTLLPKLMSGEIDVSDIEI